MTAKRTHPDLVKTPDHTHVPNETVFMFKMSPQFLEVMKFYVETSLVMDMKENDVDRPEFPDEPYKPENLINKFENSWSEESDKFSSVIGHLFVESQKRSLSKDGICLRDLKEMFCDNLGRSIGELLGSKLHGLDVFKVLFDLDFVRLKYNHSIKSALPQSVRAKITKHKVPVFLAFLDTHYLGTKMGSHKDISSHNEFIDQLTIKSNLMRNLTPTDNPTYGKASEPVTLH